MGGFPGIYLFIHSIIFLCQYGLMDICFILCNLGYFYFYKALDSGILGTEVLRKMWIICSGKFTEPNI